MIARAGYRTRQFVNALLGRPSPDDWALAANVLSPELLDLFSKLQPGEQAHSAAVLRKLVGQGERDPDLCAAALLHDAGKARYPLQLWERVLIVLVKRLSPGLAERWADAWAQAAAQGEQAPRRMRPFAVAKHHPAWGADMAAERGASVRAVRLIARHQESLEGLPENIENHLLRKLQAADDES